MNNKFMRPVLLPEQLVILDQMSRLTLPLQLEVTRELPPNYMWSLITERFVSSRVLPKSESRRIVRVVITERGRRVLGMFSTTEKVRAHCQGGDVSTAADLLWEATLEELPEFLVHREGFIRYVAREVLESRNAGK